MKSDELLIIGKEKALALFHKTYEKCPAYRAFVKEKGVDEREIVTIDDFEKIPITDRYSYLNKYPLHERIDNDFEVADFYLGTTSSGSTGKPTFWLRDKDRDDRLIDLKEDFYKEFFEIDKKRTLVVVTFVLGLWIGGILETLLAIETSRKHKLTIITPGMSVENAIVGIKELGDYFDQIIVLGYPPFVTDLMEVAIERIDMTNKSFKFVLTGDRFTEHWRTVLLKMIGSSKSTDIVGMYACSDTGIIGSETKSSIEYLRKVKDDPIECKEMFGSINPPSFVQFNPMAKYVECINEEIVITADQPIPLVRYNIHDRGGLIDNSKISMSAKKLQVKMSPVDLELPYLYLHGRTDSVLVSAANVYIDDIKYCLTHSPFTDRFSERFQFGTAETRGLKNRLKVVLYLKQGMSINEKEKQVMEQKFFDDLKEINADFCVVTQGTKTENFLFVYKEEVELDQKYKNSKLKYLIV